MYENGHTMYLATLCIWSYSYPLYIWTGISNVHTLNLYTFGHTKFAKLYTRTLIIFRGDPNSEGPTLRRIKLCIGLHFALG